MKKQKTGEPYLVWSCCSCGSLKFQSCIHFHSFSLSSLSLFKLLFSVLPIFRLLSVLFPISAFIYGYFFFKAAVILCPHSVLINANSLTSGVCNQPASTKGLDQVGDCLPGWLTCRPALWFFFFFLCFICFIFILSFISSQYSHLFYSLSQAVSCIFFLLLDFSQVA